MGLKSLQEAIIYFSKPENCREYLVARRWADGVTCPRCGKKNVIFLEKYNRWHCREKHAAPQFTLKTGTIFEDSALGLDKWLTAMWMIVNCKNGVSSWEISRALKITQKSAWFMLHRIRLAMKTGGSEKLGGDGGEVEVDETFVGGKMKNMHKRRRIEINKRLSAIPKKDLVQTAGPYSNKTPVVGMLDRETRKVRATVVSMVKRPVLQAAILKEIEQGSNVYTDESNVYINMHSDYTHSVVNHLRQYVDGQVHTNGIENFWSMLKRGLNGTYVAVEPYHLSRYVDEQVFRFNNRATRENPLHDGDRFDLAVRQIIGKRLTYKELTGKTGEQRPI